MEYGRGIALQNKRSRGSCIVVYVNLVDPAIFEVLQFFCNIRKLASLNKRKNNDCDVLKAVEKSQILQQTWK